MTKKLFTRAKPTSADGLVRDYDTNEIYVPAFEDLSAKAGIDRTALDADTITIPTALFRFLMSAWLRRLPFDAGHYLKSYPDLAEARRAGKLPSPHAHFVWTGYYEGRSPCEEAVDEAFYLSEYPDVARAVRARKINSAIEHYRRTGRLEGRSASEGQKVMKQEWTSIFHVWPHDTPLKSSS